MQKRIILTEKEYADLIVLRNRTAVDVALTFIGLEEVSGTLSQPQILKMLRLDQGWPSDDSVPWCAAFMNYIAYLLSLPRSTSLRARSWLVIGDQVPLEQAKKGFDVVILARGTDNQPGPEVLEAPGHVGLFISYHMDKVQVLGGNQSDSVNIASYPRSRILGIRRLY